MKRLDSIVQLIKGAHTVLDIGTDHGLVLIEAVKQGYIQQGIGSDVNAAPLASTETHLKDIGLSDKIKLVLSDGFENIKDSYDVVVITGMGFKLMKHILSKPHQRPNYYVLSPHHELEELRAYLSGHGYEIIDEVIVYEKKPYIILKVINNKKTLSERDILLGPVLQTKKEALPYYEDKLQVKLNYVKHLKGNDLKRVEKEINYYKNIIDTLLKS